MGEVVAEFFTSGPGADGLGPEEGYFSTADGFLVLDDGLIGSIDDGRLVGGFHLKQGGSSWVLPTWGGCDPRRIDGDLVAEEWELAEPPTASSQSLHIAVWGGICSGTDLRTEIVSTQVEETGEAVVVTVWTSPRTSEENCALLATLIPATVALADPIGDRRILDGGAVPPSEPGLR
jgi:hypothetical protein